MVEGWGVGGTVVVSIAGSMRAAFGTGAGTMFGRGLSSAIFGGLSILLVTLV